MVVDCRRRLLEWTSRSPGLAAQRFREGQGHPEIIVGRWLDVQLGVRYGASRAHSRGPERPAQRFQ